jgi:hypothetical protein
MKTLAVGIAETSNGEVRYAPNTSRSNGRFRGIIEFRY